jgi:hypothetical protein
MFAALGQALEAWALQRLLREDGGLILMGLAVTGYTLVVWKHVTVRYAYRFTLRNALDVFHAVFFGAALALGALIWWGRG